MTQLPPDLRKFSHAEWDTLLEATISQIKSLASLKGAEYAGDSDRLANFRRGGAELGVPAEEVWWIYTYKHWAAITQYISDIRAGRSRLRTEPISGRLDDLIVYSILLKAIVIERERLPAPAPEISSSPVCQGFWRPYSEYPKAERPAVSLRINRFANYEYLGRKVPMDIPRLSRNWSEDDLEWLDEAPVWPTAHVATPEAPQIDPAPVGRPV
jgi:hypothetical protein